MSLQTIKSALLTVGVPVSHFTAAKRPDKYIVWAEDSQADSLCADDQMSDQTIQGTIDYFTHAENDPIVNNIQTALTQADISYQLNSIQYEDNTKYIHYEWTFEVFADGDN